MNRLQNFSSSTFASLKVPNFRLFFWGQAISQNGTWMQLVAIDILVLEMTNDGVAVGIATAARFAPMLLLGPWAGVLADRSDRQRLLIWLNIAGAIVAAVFALSVATGVATLGWVYVLAAASGTVTALESPARRAFVVDLVEDRLFTNAVGLNSAMMTGSKIGGPAVAGILITTIGIALCFAVNALSYIPQLWLFARMNRTEFRPSERIVKGKGQLREGLRYMWDLSQLRVPLLMVTVIGTLTFNYSVVLPLFATRDLAGGAGSYTTLLSAMSIGSLIGALSIARRVDVDTRFLAMASIGLGVGQTLLAWSPNLVAATILAVPAGITTMLVISGSTTMVQLRAAPAMRGRVLAMLTVVFLGSTPVGGPIMGYVGEHMGARWALLVGSAGAFVAGVGALISLSRHENRALAPTNQLSEAV